MFRNKVRHIQIDAGAAFMKDFEETFKDLNLPLYCLSPSKPTYNGKIERSNRVFREEFYADLSENTIVGVLRELMNFPQKYNSYRLHATLHSSTSLEHIPKYNSGVLLASHLFELGHLLQNQRITEKSNEVTEFSESDFAPTFLKIR